MKEFRSLRITTKDEWENNPAGEYIGERMTLWGRDTLLEDPLTWRNNLGWGRITVAGDDKLCRG